MKADPVRKAEKGRPKALSGNIKRADLVEYICSGYNKRCFMTRNKWMVDYGILMITGFYGEKGETKNAIDYTGKQGIEVRLI